MSDFATFSAGYRVAQMARLFEQALAEALRPHGLTPGQFPTLLALWHRDGQTQAELVREIGIEQPTLALTLSRMERDGLITREPNPADSRSRIIHLTRHARSLKEDAIAAAASVNARALAEIEDEEAELFMDLSARIVSTLRERTD